MLTRLIKKHSKELDKILKYLVAAILLAVPLYPKFPFVNIPGTFVAIRLEDFLIGITLLVWFIWIWPKAKKLLKNLVIQAILVFLFIALASVISAIFLTKTAPIHIAAFHWLRRLEYVAMFAVGVTVITSQKRLSFYLRLLPIIALWAAVYGLGQKYFHFPVITTQNVEYSKGVALFYLPGGHLPATFAGHYDLATYLILTTPILFGLFFFFKSRGLKVALFLAIIASYWLLVNTVSRISIVSFIGAITLTLLLLRKYKMIPLILLASLIFFATSTQLLTRYLRVFQYLLTQAVPTVQAADINFAQVLGMEDRSTSIRLNVEWPRAIRALAKNPLLGTGFSSITLATDNDYLRLLGEVGFLGFAAFVLILLSQALHLIKLIPLPKKIGLRESFLAGIIGAFPGILLNAVFIDVFEASKFAILFWLLMGMVYSAGNLREKT